MCKIKILISLIIFISVSGLYSQVQDSLVIRYNYINSLPQNAEVFVNDSLVGRTPFFFKWDNDNPIKKIIVKQEGYAVYNFIPSADEKIINRTFKLVPLSRSRDEQIAFKNKSYSFRKPIKLVPVIISTAITAASAILGYYFKSKAIEKNDEFNETGDLSLLDKKKKYDLIGGISLAVFQVGFCALIYFHFIDN